MSSVGAIAQNLHEGSRSEYLAQYVFASFGTAVAVPHQEDTGVDLHCTLTERRGLLAWPRGHYTLQVKSTMDPWCFKGEDSVRWLVEHPLALFLCVVDKRRASIRVYHTCPRFELWAKQRIPPSLELVPTDETTGGMHGWEDKTRASLGAPIIDVTLADLLEDDVHDRTKAVLANWLEREQENLTWVRTGHFTFSMPAAYQTNSPVLEGTSSVTSFVGDIDPASVHVGRAAGLLVTPFLRRGNLLGAALCAMLKRHLLPEEIDFHNNLYLYQALAGQVTPADESVLADPNRRMEPWGVDRLIASLREFLKV